MGHWTDVMMGPYSDRISKIIEDYHTLLKTFEVRLGEIWKLWPIGRYPNIREVTTREIGINYESGCNCHPDEDGLWWPLSYFDPAMPVEAVIKDLEAKQQAKEDQEKAEKAAKALADEIKSQERKRQDYERLKKEFGG